MEKEKKNIFYYSINNKNNGSTLNKPLVILLGFFNCTERILKKFKEIWIQDEYNTILYYPSFDCSLTLLRIEVIELLKSIHNHFELNKNNEINEIIIHGISAGTFCTAMLLRYMDTLENGKYKYLTPFIKCIILDSGLPMNADDLHVGLLSTIKEIKEIKNNLNDPISLYTLKSIGMYKPLWNELNNIDMPYLYNSKFKYLIIYSEDDHFFLGSSKTFIEKLKKIAEKNKDSNYVIERTFKSLHAQHYKNNPIQYKESVDQLLNLSKL